MPPNLDMSGHVHIMELLIGYTCVGVFISTGIITVCALASDKGSAADHFELWLPLV